MSIPITQESLKRLKIQAIQEDKSMSTLGQELLEKAINTKRKKEVDEPSEGAVTAQLFD
ncbi:MAG: hypothetical protein WC753_04610 [Candidatus Gracilibacteria bacterium]